MILAPLLCLVAYTFDGDTVECADGRKVRFAAIESNEMRRRRPPFCHLPVCPAMPARVARDLVASMYQGRTLSCIKRGRSGKRIVATCSYRGRDVGCEIVRVGAAVRWEKYARQYGLPRCR